MMKKTVQWGILSTARINQRLIPELHKSEQSTLLAVASRIPQQADSYSKEWKIPRAYGSYEALLEDTEIEVVYIPLPNDLHVAWTVRALHAGKHVLCEKPLCLSLGELEQIAAASKQTGKCVMEAYMYIHHPQTALFKKLIDDGEIGEVVSLRSEFAATFNRPLDNYRMSADKGGGALWDIGVYPVSFFQYLHASPIIQVDARARVENGIDMSFWGRMDFASGVSGQFFVSFESEYSTRTSIMGTNGRLDITHPYNATTECKAWITKEGEVQEIDLPKASLFAGEIENMNDMVLGKAPPVFSLEDSLRVLDAILLLRRAAGMG